MYFTYTQAGRGATFQWATQNCKVLNRGQRGNSHPFRNHNTVSRRNWKSSWWKQRKGSCSPFQFILWKNTCTTAKVSPYWFLLGMRCMTLARQSNDFRHMPYDSLLMAVSFTRHRGCLNWDSVVPGTDVISGMTDCYGGAVIKMSNTNKYTHVTAHRMETI